MEKKGRREGVVNVCSSHTDRYICVRMHIGEVWLPHCLPTGSLPCVSPPLFALSRVVVYPGSPPPSRAPLAPGRFYLSLLSCPDHGAASPRTHTCGPQIKPSHRATYCPLPRAPSTINSPLLLLLLVSPSPSRSPSHSLSPLPSPSVLLFRLFAPVFYTIVKRSSPARYDDTYNTHRLFRCPPRGESRRDSNFGVRGTPTATPSEPQASSNPTLFSKPRITPVDPRVGISETSRVSISTIFLFFFQILNKHRESLSTAFNNSHYHNQENIYPID